jgi:hypothetical protein
VMTVRRRAWKIDILEESDGGNAANGAEKRESERAQRGQLRCAVAGSQAPGFVGLSKVEWRRTPQNVKKSDTFEEMQHRTSTQRESKRSKFASGAREGKTVHDLEVAESRIPRNCV